MTYGWGDRKTAEFEDLRGKTLKAITGLDIGSENVVFETEGGRKFAMWYDQDCCASCSIEEIHGDIEDLIGSPILLAEESSSREPDPVLKASREKEKAETKARGGYYYEETSETWTFYKLATIKGSMTIRWYGESNGYYSESTSFHEIKTSDDQ